MNRQKCIEKIFRDVEGKLPITGDDFSKSIEKWNVYPLIFDGNLAAIVMIFDTEMHIGFCEFAAKYGRKIYKHCIVEHIEKNGMITTKIWKQDCDAVKTVNFLSRLGFLETHEDNNFRYFCLMKKNFYLHGEIKCQSPH